MKIGFYAYDVAAGNAMEILAQAATARGHEAVLFPKQERGVAVKRSIEMIHCDLLVTGLSSFQTKEELDLVHIFHSLATARPWVVFEDVPNACRRPLAESHAPAASAVILAHPSGEVAAKQFGYKETVYLGPPPQWRLDYETLMAAKAENCRVKMHKIRGSSSAVPLENDDVIIGLIGGKDPRENNRVLEIVVKAISDMGLTLAFGKHPGEKAEKEEDETVFEKLLQERRRTLSDVWTATTDGMKGAQIAGAADIMIYASGTNISIAGAYARVPAIYLDDEGVRSRMRAQSGSPEWFVAELEGCLVAHDIYELRSRIGLLSTVEGQQYCRLMQERSFPLPEDWHTENKIIQFLEQNIT